MRNCQRDKLLLKIAFGHAIFSHVFVEFLSRIFQFHLNISFDIYKSICVYHSSIFISKRFEFSIWDRFFHIWNWNRLQLVFCHFQAFSVIFNFRAFLAESLPVPISIVFNFFHSLFYVFQCFHMFFNIFPLNSSWFVIFHHIFPFFAFFFSFFFQVFIHFFKGNSYENKYLMKHFFKIFSVLTAQWIGMVFCE